VYQGGNPTTKHFYEGCLDVRTIGFPPSLGEGVGQDDRGDVSSGDWSPGDYKAECSSRDQVTGISLVPGTSITGNVLCSAGSDTVKASDKKICHDVDFSGGDNRFSSGVDWDFGKYKGECATNEYIAGVSQGTRGGIVSILCCQNAGVTHQNPTALPFETSDDRLYGGDGDWAQYEYKAECAQGQYACGLSRDLATGAPHALLCCTP
jgi:hypothetical protein